MKYLLFLLLTVILLGFFMPSKAHEMKLSVPDGAQINELTALTSCEYQPVGSNTKIAAACGTLTVPENRQDANSRLIALPVIRIPATKPNPSEPIFWFQGGPGSSNLTWAPPAWLLEKHDVVIVGYRGMDGSVLLDCPDASASLAKYFSNNFLSEPFRQELVAAVKQCAAGFQAAGIDLSGYTIANVVEDMEVARQALGYQKINLYSVSYGTRPAQLYAYLYPDRLHRVVMLGVNTPGHFIYDRHVFDDMLHHISDLCSQNSTCSSRTDDLAHAIYNVNHNMPKQWLFFPIDQGSIRFGTQMLFFSNTNMPMIIDAYLSANDGDPSGLAMLNLMGKVMAIPITLGDMLSKGGSADLARYQGLESVSLGDSIMGAPMSEMVWPMAEAWPIGLMDEKLRDFQESDVDMLLVNGTVDFSTPPTALEEAKPYYHHAQMVLLSEFSHVSDIETLQPAAFEHLITSYYDTGIADASLFEYQPISFGAGLSLSIVAKLLVGGMIGLPVLLIGLVIFIVRRVRRRAQGLKHG